MRFLRVCLLAMLLFLFQGKAFAQENNSFIHTVKKGETLYSLSIMYNVPIADIVTLNPGSDKTISIGQQLRIPQQTVRDTNEDTSANGESQKFHTIKPGETLYRLTQIYHIPAKVLCDANPGLSVSNFKAGQVVLIPQYTDTIVQPLTQTVPETVKKEDVPSKASNKKDDDSSDNCRLEHKVQKGETLYYLTHLYNITEEELVEANPILKKKKLKRKMVLCIPYSKAEKEAVAKQNTVVTPPTNSELFESVAPPVETKSLIKAAVILPFEFSDSASTERGKMIEYYEGFLMAVDSLKRLGYSTELFTYDSGSKYQSLNPILQREEMKKMDIIFGPYHLTQTKELADFAQTYNIPLVTPFTSKGDVVFTNPKVYQVNTPQSYFYSEVYEHFSRSFPQAQVIFLGDTIEDGKADFIKGFKNELDLKRIPYTTVSLLLFEENIEKFVESIDSTRENFFVPLSSSSSMLNSVTPVLQVLLRNDTLNVPTNYHLFGYPEWQIYAHDHLTEFYEIDTYFYSSFYTNNLLYEAVQFNNDFYKWYSHDIANSFPKYGMLGFDTGYYFLLALNKFGSDMDNRIGELQFNPIQTGFKFERVNNWGGFINKKVFFVHFSRDYRLHKINFD